MKGNKPNHIGIVLSSDIAEMKVDDSPFPGDQNMVDARLIKKTKVLTSTKSREAGTVDPKMQISTDEYREIKRRHDKQKSRYKQGKTSKDGATKPRVTSRILLNKWQRQKEKDYQRWLEDQESKPNRTGIVVSSDTAGTKA